MHRLFSEHKVRPAWFLDGVWQLSADGGCYSCIVPGIWESIPALAQYRGKAVMTRTFTLDHDSHLLLRFGGVSHTAKVYLDDVPATIPTIPAFWTCATNRAYWSGRKPIPAPFPEKSCAVCCLPDRLSKAPSRW